MLTQQAQNICKTFIQCRINVFDVGPALYKCIHMFCVCWKCTWHGDVGGVDGAQTVVGEDERVPVLQVNLQEVVEVVVDVEDQGVTLDCTEAEDQPGGQGSGDGLRVEQLLHVHGDGVSVQQIRLRAPQVHHVVVNI